MLVAVVAILGVIVWCDSMRQWYGYVILKRPFTSSEVIAMAGGGSPGRVQTAIYQDGVKQEERDGFVCRMAAVVADHLFVIRIAKAGLVPGSNSLTHYE